MQISLNLTRIDGVEYQTGIAKIRKNLVLHFRLDFLVQGTRIGQSEGRHRLGGQSSIIKEICKQGLRNAKRKTSCLEDDRIVLFMPKTNHDFRVPIKKYH